MAGTKTVNITFFAVNIQDIQAVQDNQDIVTVSGIYRKKL
jgi:hypothetical protein